MGVFKPHEVKLALFSVNSYMKDLSASIVVCKNSAEMLRKTIQGFLKRTRYELGFSGYIGTIIRFPVGCFMFLITEALRKVGLFDEQFFPYTANTDALRRIDKHYRTVYLSQVPVHYRHQRGPYWNPWLLPCNFNTAARYFNSVRYLEQCGLTNDREQEFFNLRTKK
jgi:hypothetical protein